MKLKKYSAAFTAAFLALALASTAYAHPGRLDSYGGHNKTSDGTYHYHREGDELTEYGSWQEANPGQTPPAGLETHERGKNIVGKMPPAPVEAPKEEEAPALPEITVYHNGEQIIFDQSPVIENGYTLVPVRAIFEKLGLALLFDAETKIITANGNDQTIIMTIDSDTALVNGAEQKLDAQAKIINGRTLVPLRFVAESLNLNVEWNGTDRTINLTEK